MYYQASIFSSASCPTCFSFNYCNSSLRPNLPLIWAKLTLLRTLLIQWLPQRLQEKADKIFPLAFFVTQQQKTKAEFAKHHYKTVKKTRFGDAIGFHLICFKFQRPAGLSVLLGASPLQKGWPGHSYSHCGTCPVPCLVHLGPSHLFLLGRRASNRLSHLEWSPRSVC